MPVFPPRLTSVCSRIVARSDRPFKVGQTQRGDFRVCAASPMDYCDTPNPHIQPHKTSTDLALCIQPTSRSDTNPTGLRNSVGETAYQEWRELDRLLTHLWELHSSWLKVLYDAPVLVDEQIARSCMVRIFLEVTRRGRLGELTWLKAGMGGGDFGNPGAGIDIEVLFGQFAR